jgi:putative tricarboxylic transport membrane protein
MVHGVIPGPFLITQHSGLFWGVIASFYIGNVMLLILNYPLVGVFASLTKMRCSILMPIVAGMVLIGVYSLDNNSFDLWIALLFGVLAYVMKEFAAFPLVPIVVGYILGPMLERSFRQAIVLSDGSFWTMMQRPVCAVFMGLACLVPAIGLIRYFVMHFKKRMSSRKPTTEGGFFDR